MRGFEVGVGVDVESVERWRKDLPTLMSGPRRGFFTEEEHAYCLGYSDPAPHYAARWCGKEAVVKALAKVCLLDPRAVEIVRGPNGAPEPRVTLPAPLAGGVLELQLSLTHSREIAMAFAIAVVPHRRRARKRRPRAGRRSR